MARRRRRPPVWLLVGLAALVVVIVAVALPGSSPSPDRQSYLDVIRPQLQRSAQLGAVVRDIRANAASFDRIALTDRLDDLVTSSATVQREVAAVGVPGSLSSAGNQLQQSLKTRAQAASTLRTGMQAALSTGTINQAVAQLAAAGRQLSAGDDAYGRFQRALPRSMAASVSVPDFRWVASPGDWSLLALSPYVVSLRFSSSLAVRHDVGVILVTTQPAPTSYLGSVAVLGLARQLTASVVVADSGNVPEHGVNLVATLSGFGTQTQSQRRVVDLDTGQRLAVDFGGMQIRPGVLYSLSVRVGPVGADPTPGDDQQVSTLAVAG